MSLTACVLCQVEKRFKWLWADHGDDISRQYAGTGALKSGFTRTGKRTTFGLLDDGVKSVVRYYLNNFCDGRKQDAVDLITGNYSISKGIHNGASLSADSVPRAAGEEYACVHCVNLMQPVWQHVQSHFPVTDMYMWQHHVADLSRDASSLQMGLQLSAECHRHGFLLRSL